MVKKRSWEIFLIFLLFIIALSSVFAANDSATTSTTSGSSSNIISSSSGDANADKAYRCLESQIANKSTLSFQEAVFSMLALGSKGKLRENIESQKNSRESCWPKEGCRIKETAQVALAYKRAGISTTEILNWLKSKKGTPSEMTWFLEIDIVNHIPANCIVKYDNKEFRTSVKEDMKLSASAGNCLILSSNEFWLRISNDCLDKSFEISCDQDFISALIYQKAGGETVFVSSETHSAPSLGKTSEKVEAKCFKTGNVCDYEGSLWATLALENQNEDVSDVLPYLTALSEENSKYFAPAFLYVLTSDSDYYNQIIQLRKQNQYWEVSGNTYNRFYDTSLGMLALGSSSSGSSELQSTKTYLFGIQTKEGCWNNNNIRDTAFLLYSGWPRGAVSGGGGTSKISCVEAGFSCERLSECLSAGGTQQMNYECPSAATVCCSIKVVKKTCREENGKICGNTEECDGATFEAGDGACCLGNCVPKETPITTESACEKAGGSCREKCGSGEEESSESCNDEAKVCCVEKEGGSNWWIIILLILLIILVILAIKFRDRIRVFWLKYQGKAKVTPINKPSSPATPSYSGPPASHAPMQSGPRPFAPPPAGIRRGPVAPPSSQKDKEMEETLRKLKEMTK